MALQLISDSNATIERLQIAIGNIEEAVKDGLSDTVFIRIPEDKVFYYENPDLFGQKVTNKFPKAITDIQEAGACLATGRYTATVFHLMRVMEIGVRHLGKKLKVPNPDEPEWQKIQNDVNGVLKRLSSPPTPITARQKARRDKYAQAAVYLENVKNAWRNNVMHPKAAYTGEEAVRIFEAVKSYMQFLAEIL